MNRGYISKSVKNSRYKACRVRRVTRVPSDSTGLKTPSETMGEGCMKGFCKIYESERIVIKITLTCVNIPLTIVSLRLESGDDILLRNNASFSLISNRKRTN